jgi:hypothetical protein
MTSTTLGLAAVLAAGLSGTALAQDLKAEPKFTDTQIAFDAGGGLSNFTLSIAGPNRIHASASAKNSAPSIDLKRLGTVDDGIYTYQLTASTDEKIPVRSPLDNGRSSPPVTAALKVVSTTGHFQVKGGIIVKADPNAREEQKRQK